MAETFFVVVQRTPPGSRRGQKKFRKTSLRCPLLVPHQNIFFLKMLKCLLSVPVAFFFENVVCINVSFRPMCAKKRNEQKAESQKNRKDEYIPVHDWTKEKNMWVVWIVTGKVAQGLSCRSCWRVRKKSSPSSCRSENFEESVATESSEDGKIFH